MKTDNEIQHAIDLLQSALKKGLIPPLVQDLIGGEIAALKWVTEQEREGFNLQAILDQLDKMGVDK